MKPIPSQPHSITLTNVAQSYLDIFIPKNSMGIPKKIVIQALVTIRTRLPNQIGGPFYLESYGLDMAGAIPRGGNLLVAPVPNACTFAIEREFYYDGVGIVEYNWDAVPGNGSVSAPDNKSHLIDIISGAGPISNTVDHYINFQMKTSFVGSIDTVQCGWAQAFIQSPLDLRRLAS